MSFENDLISWAKREQASIAEGAMRAAPGALIDHARGRYTMLDDLLKQIGNLLSGGEDE